MNDADDPARPAPASADEHAAGRGRIEPRQLELHGRRPVRRDVGAEIAEQLGAVVVPRGDHEVRPVVAVQVLARDPRPVPALRVAGILACRLDHRTNHGPEIVEKLRARFPETFRAVIRENVRLAECPSMGEPITAYAPTSPGAADYRALAAEVIRQEGEGYGAAAND